MKIRISETNLSKFVKKNVITTSRIFLIASDTKENKRSCIKNIKINKRTIKLDKSSANELGDKIGFFRTALGVVLRKINFATENVKLNTKKYCNT